MNYLYRHFDAKRRLLYIGVTANLDARMAAHRSSSHWHDQIAFIEAEKISGGRKIALRAEANAIGAERPIYNKANLVAPGVTKRKRIAPTGNGYMKTGYDNFLKESKNNRKEVVSLVKKHKNMSAVARALGISRERVRQIYAQEMKQIVMDANK